MQEIPYPRFVLDRAASSALRLWMPSVGVFATSITTNRGALEWIGKIPLWNLALILVFVIHPMFQAGNPLRAEAARAGKLTRTRRLGVLVALAAVNVALLFILGVAFGSSGGFSERLDSYTSFFITPGFIFLNVLLAVYSFAALRPPFAERDATFRRPR
ncbi:hypothetical protein OG306_22865 [Streptomyces sp. NBC_01241]|uniref:hypothetical protein n=1 Tax=Streptomyces sp. NBC_01241 TaxID=2903794 RepID=UPI00352F3750|nr:hypothetical protein OG306_22865 [Streptomyces sp. NBC_01241]